jgi:hypothetical protein
MFVYGIVPGAEQTTSGTPNTELPMLSIRGVASPRQPGIIGLYVHGRGAGLTAITGISFRIKLMASAFSTGGTALTASPRDPGAQAAATTNITYAGTAITDGTGPSLRLSIGCGAAGASGWFAQSEQAVISQKYNAGGNPGCMDTYVASGLASMKFEMSQEFSE